ncbi:MAG: O-antigen ligase family protein [Acetobacteraceae bacterium]|nr:O-antigen ligase family protein [Acetobacteraceae bacterium]
MLTWIRANLEIVFSFLAMSVLFGAYTPLPRAMELTDAIKAGESDPTTLVANIAILTGLLVFCFVHRRSFILAVSRGLWTNLFLGLAFFSALWSMDPAVTLRRMGPLLIIICFGYFLAIRFPVQSIIRMAALALVISAIASAVVAIGLPQYGVMHGVPGAIESGELEGDWRGVFSHKSSLGAEMLVGCLCCGWLLVHERRHRVLSAAGFVICLALAVMSGSRTSEVVIVLLPILGCFLRGLQLPGMLRVWAIYLVTVGLGLAAVIAVCDFDGLMAFLGKDATLTGRVPLWGVVLDAAASRPVLGYGYGAFWLDWNTQVNAILKAVNWHLGGSHNGYLDMVLELGVVGLIVSCGLLLSVLRQSVRGVLRGNPPWASFSAMLTITLVITTFVDETLLHPGDAAGLLLCALYAAWVLERSKSEERVRSPSLGAIPGSAKA